MRHRERGHHLDQLAEGPAEEQQAEEEGDVVVAREDVLDAEQQEPARRRQEGDAALDLETRLALRGHPLRDLSGSERDACEVGVTGSERVDEADAHAKQIRRRGAAERTLDEQAVGTVRPGARLVLASAGPLAAGDGKPFERQAHERGQRPVDLRLRQGALAADGKERREVGGGEVHLHLDAVAPDDDFQGGDALLVRPGGERHEQRREEDGPAPKAGAHCWTGRAATKRRCAPSSLPRPGLSRWSRVSPCE